MKEINKMKSGLEYCFDDEEVMDLKLNAVKTVKYTTILMYVTGRQNMTF